MLVVAALALVACKGKGNDQGKLGSAAGGPPKPAEVTLKAIKIAAGDGAACAVMDNGRVRCWGRNDNGERGSAKSRDDAATPVQHETITGAVDIVMGGDSGSSGDIACAITADRKVSCWGGEQMLPQTPLDGAVSIALGGGTGYIVDPAGGVSGWGSPAFNALADGTTGSGSDKPLARLRGIEGAKQVAAGQNHACALLGDGTVTCWGYPGKAQLPTVVAGLSGVTAIFGESQRDVTCAVVASGAQCWDERGVPEPVAEATGKIKKIAGRTHLCALAETGAVTCWGDRDYKAKGLPTNAASPGFAGARSEANAERRWIDIAVGHAFACAVLADGSAACWGYNQRGQLGDGTLTDRATPVAVVGLTADRLAPVKSGLDAVQEGVTPTAWDSMPAACKNGPIEITAKDYEGKTFVVRGAKATSQMEGKSVAIALADHQFHSGWGQPRGKQGVLGLRLAKVMIKGDKREPASIDRGDYKIGGKEERLVIPTLATKTGTATLITIGLQGVDAGKVAIAYLDDKWICGDVALAAEGSSVKGSFAAPFTK